MNSCRSYVVNAIIDWILDNGCTPYIVLDTSVDGVDVPTEGIKGNQITLNVTPRAVVNFDLSPDGLIFDARFHGVSRRITSPVGAIVGIYAKENQQGLFFPVEDSDEAESVTKVSDDDSTTPSNTIEFKIPK